MLLILSISGLGLVLCRPPEQESYTAPPGKALEFRGAAIAHVHRRGSGYGHNATSGLYKHLKAAGYDSVQFNTFAYQEGNHSTDLQWNDPTLTTADLAQEIAAAKAAGFTVLLKPHVWVGGWTNDAAQQWRSKIRFEDPADLDRWFAAYATFLLEQARIAEAGGAEVFAVGTELVALSRETKHWRTLIAKVRKIYSGKLTYACEAWNAKNIEFWEDLDYIGLDFYYRYDVDQHGDPSLDELADHYAAKLREHYAHARSLNRPVLLTELGFPSHDHAVRMPHAWPNPEYAADQELQAFAYRAMREAFTRAGAPAGVWIWKYATTLDSYEGRAYKRGFLMKDKMAEAVIKEMFTER